MLENKIILTNALIDRKFEIIWARYFNLFYVALIFSFVYACYVLEIIVSTVCEPVNKVVIARGYY